MSNLSERGRVDAAQSRRLRFLLGSMSLAVLAGGLVYLGAFPAGLAIVVVFGGAPLLGYAFGVRSLPGSVFAGLALLAVSIGTTLFVIDERASSTAALGYLMLPIVGIPLVLVAVLLDRAIRSPSGSVLAGTTLLAATIGTMLYLMQESAADSFCDHANGLGNTMIEIGPGRLTVSESERLEAFHGAFVSDAQALRGEGLTESARVAGTWAHALADVEGAGSQAERDAAYDRLRRVVRDLYGSGGTCPDIR